MAIPCGAALLHESAKTKTKSFMAELFLSSYKWKVKQNQAIIVNSLENYLTPLVPCITIYLRSSIAKIQKLTTHFVTSNPYYL